MKKQIAFVLSGGGAKGCLQVGMLNYLINNKRIIPDFVYGISTGSLQGLAIAQNDLILLNQVWRNIKSEKDIFSKSILNYVSILLGKSAGLYKFTGLKNILTKIFNKHKLLSSGITYSCGYINLTDGEIYYKTSSDVTIDNILSSCTIPIAFPPINNLYVDGGVRDIAPLKKAIDDGATDIYVLLCSPTQIKPLEKKYTNILDVAMRTIDIMTNEILLNDIKYATKINEIIKKTGSFEDKRQVNIYLIAPLTPVIDTLEFSPVKIKKGIEYGYQLAKDSLK